MTVPKPYILTGVVALIIGSIFLLNALSVQKGGLGDPVTVLPRTAVGSDAAARMEKHKNFELAKEITTPDGFINTDGAPISVAGLIGKKIILVDFWTYSCINCQRTTPYLNEWYEKYKDAGLEIIGVHTPEFEFEKDYDNVKAAVEKFGITFPVVLDNDYSTWTAYENRYWPRKYLIDIDGYIVYDHIGEGAYEETEEKIRVALADRLAVLGEAGIIDQPITKEISVQNLAKSPETYFGAFRNHDFGNGKQNVVGAQMALTVPSPIEDNTLYLAGDWNIADQFAQNSSSGARIVYTYTAKDVFFVAEADRETVVEVLIDGEPLGSRAGADVVTTPEGKTIVNIQDAGLYTIIQDTMAQTHTIEFRIPVPGLKAFTFTFG